MQGICSTLTSVTNATDIVGQAMTQLIKKWLNVSTWYGWRPLGDDPTLMNGNCVIFVEPAPGQLADLVSLGKYKRTFDFFIYWYVVDNSSQDIVSLYTSVGENLIKLFSQNALNDLQTASPASHQFRAYEPYWDDSDMGKMSGVPTFQNNLEGRSEKYMRRGRLSINVRQELVLI